MARDLYRPFDSTDDRKDTPSSSTSKDSTPKDYYRPWVEPPPIEKPPEERLEIEPRNEVLDDLTRVAAGATGAAAGAGLRYRSGMFGPEAGSKYMTSQPGMDMYRQSQFALGTPQGQVTEGARRNLQDLLAKLEGANSVYSQEGRALLESLERAIANLPEASVERNIALARLAEIGGIKAPPTPPLSSPIVSGADDVINRIQSATTSSGQPVSGLSRAMGQHEFEMQAKALREAGARTVDDLLRLGVVDRSLAQYMVDTGMLLPTPEGRVLVRPQVLMGESGQPISAEDTAARQAAADAEARQAAARRQAEIVRAREVELARRNYQATGKTVANLESIIPNLTEKYAAHMGATSPAALKLEPNVRMAQEALLDAQNRMPSKAGYAMHGMRRALPLAGGAISGAMAGESGVDAYQRSQKGDPIGSAIAGATSALSAASLYPPATIPAGLGAIGMEGVMYLYDKFGPKVLPILEEKGLLPKSFNPANYSVMDQK